MRNRKRRNRSNCSRRFQRSSHSAVMATSSDIVTSGYLSSPTQSSPEHVACPRDVKCIARYVNRQTTIFLDSMYQGTFAHSTGAYCSANPLARTTLRANTASQNDRCYIRWSSINSVPHIAQIVSLLIVHLHCWINDIVIPSWCSTTINGQHWRHRSVHACLQTLQFEPRGTFRDCDTMT